MPIEGSEGCKNEQSDKPEVSHLAMLEAVAGRALLDEAYAEAFASGYLWHEFGDSHLLLPYAGGR